MIKTLNGLTEGVYKVTTSHGTHYIIDLDNNKGKRVPAADRNEMEADNDWFRIGAIETFEVGEPMYMHVRGITISDWYTWRRTTDVTLIERIIEE